MKFSKIILNKSNAPKHLINNLTTENIYLLKLENLNSYIEIGFNVETRQGDEFLLHLEYKTALQGPYLGIIEGLFELYQSKAVQAITRITAKELDYYLRDVPTDPAISYYEPKFYDILGIGEKLNKLHYKQSTKEELIYDQFDGVFHGLSFSEQIETFEEFLAKCVYKDSRFLNIRFDLEDVTDQKMLISYQCIQGHNFSEELKRYLKNKLYHEIGFDGSKISFQEKV